jgi:hypothetical protein
LYPLFYVEFERDCKLGTPYPKTAQNPVSSLI